jgi:hypothetical protein
LELKFYSHSPPYGVSANELTSFSLYYSALFILVGLADDWAGTDDHEHSVLDDLRSNGYIAFLLFTTQVEKNNTSNMNKSV